MLLPFRTDNLFFFFLILFCLWINKFRWTTMSIISLSIRPIVYYLKAKYYKWPRKLYEPGGVNEEMKDKSYLLLMILLGIKLLEILIFYLIFLSFQDFSSIFKISIILFHENTIYLHNILLTIHCIEYEIRENSY